MRNGNLFVISGPSGAGKGTLVTRLAQRVPDVWVSRSMTTRSPREGEIDGVHYDFLTEEAFMDLVRQDGFLEWARYADHCYGTPLKRIQDMIAAGKQIVLEIDVQGAFQVRDKMPEAHLVFVVPPSLEGLDMTGASQGSFSANGFQASIQLSNPSGTAYFDRSTLAALRALLGTTQAIGTVCPSYGAPRC